MHEIYSLFGGAISRPYVHAVVTFLIVLLIGSLIRLILQRIVKPIIKRTSTTLDDQLFAIYAPQIKWLTLIIGLMLAVNELSKAIPKGDETSVMIMTYTGDLLYAATILVLTVLIARTFTAVIGHVMEAYSSRSENDLSRELAPLLQRIANILAAFVGIVVVMERFGIPASSLLVFLGGGSVALALAAQDTLSNMIAGFVIMIDRPFRVGDRIKLPSGEIGDVFEIGLRSTKIQDFDNNLIISPNAELVKAKVINFAYPVRIIRVLVEVGVAYGTDTERARRVLVNLAKHHRHVLGEHEPAVYVTELGDSAVTLRLVARTDDFTKKFEAETELREEIHATFQKEGIEIPFPQRVIHFAPETDGKAPRTRNRTTIRRKNR